MSSGDTIAAIATAPGQAGIGIVRLSGPDALACARAVFFRERNGQRTPLDTELRPRQVVYGGVAEGMAGSRLDSCLLTYFQAPRSYTGEDVVELACHGSTVVLSLLLQALLGTGARLAEPGEFTRRAFLNGRLDLTEAESVMDLIAARTAAAARVAAGQQGGRLAREIEALRMLLLDLLAEIEASIDFPDDVDPLPDCELAARAEEVRARCSRLLATSGAGRLYREGARLVIVGRPNVGKSSLLNALLGENRAIVTEVAGTTRDVVEEDVNLGGIPVRAADTAGLRETEDRIEALGVERTRERLASADLV
ncbi:MAG: tRNA uridine-5-carboxymethylaminomethyl(34) synthesis GTPase MnmE, partial [Armatimonadetes bacterium]|nr:tRNA uridine-5-carboxymethylaminomethyl(34) synthesis GTPase MnmE [Armatimonadota bacterium]